MGLLRPGAPLWSLKDLGNGYSQLVASHSGQCLTVLDGNTADGANYIQNDCTATPSTFSQFTCPPQARAPDREPTSGYLRSALLFPG